MDIRMVLRLLCLNFVLCVIGTSLFGQELAGQQPADLQVQLRSATGSTRFQIGEVIPLEVVFSSSAPNRYLEPCVLFRDSNFGFPQCRFVNRWAFTIAPENGWVDLTQEFPSGPVTGGGPMFEVPARDLTATPVAFSYLLTKRFRFDKPGDYRVRLSIDIGLDDASTARNREVNPAAKPNSVTLTPEVTLQIVPPSPEWEDEIIHKGYQAYAGPIPRTTDPPSPELLQYQQDTRGLCNLGTPEAARALARLLSQGHSEVDSCLRFTPSPSAAIAEMQTLLVAPDVAVRDPFFMVLVQLLSREESQKSQLPIVSQRNVDSERDRLFAALPGKTAEAQIPSLITILTHPPRAKSTLYNFGYDVPFAPPVIATVVANYDRFPKETQAWLLDFAWDPLDSPQMLEIVRQRAREGDGQALLRWLELDVAGATDFIRQEIVRPVPRFSAFYLRLPDTTLPGQEEQIARNFVALTQVQDLARSATLLHRYAGPALLPVVLPFILEKRAQWPCAVQLPALAYLLKVSPENGASQVERSLQELGHGPCNDSTFLSDLGFLQPSPVLERLAMSQIAAGAPTARDAVGYLQSYGSTNAKPFLWKQFVRWHRQFLAGGGDKRELARKANEQDAYLHSLVSALAEAFRNAQAWVLSPQEVKQMEAELGAPVTASSGCEFICNASFAAGPGPGDFAIYGGLNQAWQRKPSPSEYLNPKERLYYLVANCRCADMKALKEKLLQLPQGSSFTFAYEFSMRDQQEVREIIDFLLSHGYKVKNPQGWSFLPPDPSH